MDDGQRAVRLAAGMPKSDGRRRRARRARVPRGATRWRAARRSRPVFGELHFGQGAAGASPSVRPAVGSWISGCRASPCGFLRVSCRHGFWASSPRRRKYWRATSVAMPRRRESSNASAAAAWAEEASMARCCGPRGRGRRRGRRCCGSVRFGDRRLAGGGRLPRSASAELRKCRLVPSRSSVGKSFARSTPTRAW